MKHKLVNLLLTIPLLTTFYLVDGSYIWKSPDAWSYWTYKQKHESGWKGDSFNVQVPLGVKFWHEGTVWRVPFNQIVKITDE